MTGLSIDPMGICGTNNNNLYINVCLIVQVYDRLHRGSREVCLEGPHICERIKRVSKGNSECATLMPCYSKKSIPSINNWLL